MAKKNIAMSMGNIIPMGTVTLMIIHMGIIMIMTITVIITIIMTIPMDMTIIRKRFWKWNGTFYSKMKLWRQETGGILMPRIFLPSIW
nr:hypothetical protein [uncultured Allomuricauda sp.]